MATKLAIREATISKTESLVLMKNMMRISISSICYARDLFPKSCFKGKPYGNMEIHQLQGAKKEDDGEIIVTHPDAFLLTQWLEQGVFQALELEYLSTVTFAIYSSHPITGEEMLLETYEFKVSYRGEQESAKINDVSLVSKEAVKNHAAKFIRSLTEFSGTLDSLPDTCWITLQLKYYDHTPSDYEPEYFTASNGSVSAAADRLPLIINIGNLRTPCVDMKMKFAGLESLLFDDLCKVTPKASMRADTPKQPSIFQGTKCCITEDMERMAVSPYTTQNSPSPPPIDATEKNETLAEPLSAVGNITSPIELSREDQVKTAIMNGCGGGLRGLQICAKKTSLPMDTVKKIIDDLLKKGKLKRKGRGFVVPSSTVPVTVAANETESALPKESEAPHVPALVQNDPNGAQPVLMTPQDIDTTSTSTRCMQVPSAPRKVPKHMQPIQDSPMMDDIEETFQDSTDSPKEDRNKPTNYHQQSLQLQRGKDRDETLSVASKKTTTAMHTSSVEEKEEQSYDHMSSITAQKRTIKEAISLSQESVISEVSATTAPRKRLRKCSEIKDPIRLTELQTVARANQQLQQ